MMKKEKGVSLRGVIADIIGLNRRFSKYKKIDEVDSRSNIIISPVEAKVVYTGRIGKDSYLISKHKKIVSLYDQIGDYAKEFIGGSYINFYLSPINKHFWVVPHDGKFIYTRKTRGRAIIPTFISLENLLGIPLMHKAVKKNACVASVFKTKHANIAMIAVGSLNVNRINITYEENRLYKKGTPCGHFSIGSSMLLCFPYNVKPLVLCNDKVKIGSAIAMLHKTSNMLY